MNISSAQPDCSITSSSSDTITFVNGVVQDVGFTAQDIGSLISDDIITISDTGSSYYYTGTGSSQTITLTGGAGASTTYTIGGISSISNININPATFNWKDPEEFVDCLPDISRIQEMCNEYPGLKIAYEKFVTTYRLVKDDYDTPKDQRQIP